MILIMSLIEEVTAVLLGINQYGIILYTQGKSQEVLLPHLEE